MPLTLIRPRRQQRGSHALPDRPLPFTKPGTQPNPPMRQPPRQQPCNHPLASAGHHHAATTTTTAASSFALPPTKITASQIPYPRRQPHGSTTCPGLRITPCAPLRHRLYPCRKPCSQPSTTTLERNASPIHLGLSLFIVPLCLLFSPFS
jgi:hypothetical protein